MKKVIIYICLTAFLFSTMEVALKTGGSDLDSIQLTFLRFLIGGIILFPLGMTELRKKDVALTKGDIGWICLVGIMGIPISMLCFQLGVERCNAATAASIICLNPLFTMVIAHLFTSEKMTRNKAIAFAIGLVAAVFMIRPWDVQEGNTIPGMIYMMVSSITFAAYTVMGKRTIGKVGTFAQTSVSFIVGSMVLLVALFILKRPVLAGVTDNWMIVLYVGVFVTGIGYLTYFLAIRYSDATTGSIAFFIKPAIAPFMAMFFLMESILWNTVVGVVLLLSASFITLWDNWYSVATPDKYRNRGK